MLQWNIKPSFTYLYFVTLNEIILYQESLVLICVCVCVCVCVCGLPHVDQTYNFKVKVP